MGIGHGVNFSSNVGPLTARSPESRVRCDGSRHTAHLHQGRHRGGAIATSAAYLFRGPGALLGQTSAPGSVERLITLNVNGQMRRVDVMKQETLAMTLRYKLGLTGTKLGCDRAECGACTVLIDDVPHYSCSVLTHTVRGRAGRRRSKGSPAPTASCIRCSRRCVDEQGFQCAFCMPGFMMATVGFLKTNPNPTRQELAHGISGNLCRCQDYDKILTALMRGAEYMRRAVQCLTDKLIGAELHAARSRRQGHRHARSTPRTSAPTACSSPSCCSARCRTRACAASTRAPRWRCPA